MNSPAFDLLALTDVDAVRASRLVRLRRSIPTDRGHLPAGSVLAVVSVREAICPTWGSFGWEAKLDNGAGHRAKVLIKRGELAAIDQGAGGTGSLDELPVLVSHREVRDDLFAAAGLINDDLRSFSVSIVCDLRHVWRANVMVEGECVWHGLVDEPSESALAELVRLCVLEMDE